MREPVDRVLSRFWYPRSQPRDISALAATFDRMPTRRRLWRRRGKELSTSRQLEYSNAQSRRLLEPYYDVRSQLPISCGPPRDADLWRERIVAIADTYILLRNDRLDEDFARLAAEWGWNVEQTERIRVNTCRPRYEDLPDGLRDRIRAFNWLDEELHRYALDRLHADKEPTRT